MTRRPVAGDNPPPDLPSHGPTELVEDERGELVERLSSGTATLLLMWLVGVGALSTLLAAWLFVWLMTGERLGFEALCGGFGLYTSLAGAAGPCILWLSGRAQGHGLRWFLLTAAKISLLMVGIIVAVVVIATLILAGTLPNVAAAGGGLLMAGMALVLSVIWGLATWSADRWIARARVAA
ncbi:MAG: hypothetical protein ACXWWO_05855 [Candidatus Limnocylindria bacterium]